MQPARYRQLAMQPARYLVMKLVIAVGNAASKVQAVGCSWQCSLQGTGSWVQLGTRYRQLGAVGNAASKVQAVGYS